MPSDAVSHSVPAPVTSGQRARGKPVRGLLGESGPQCWAEDWFHWLPQVIFRGARKPVREMGKSKTGCGEELQVGVLTESGRGQPGVSRDGCHNNTALE